jgi:predicted O-linked N-acetylglucosamine transferase (SPINDLY family)
VISITGTPLLTKEGEFIRSRVGAYYCRLLDLEECIAKDTEGYVRKAVEIASDPSLRDTIRTKILQNCNLLYDNMQPTKNLTDFFCSLTDLFDKQP